MAENDASFFLPTNQREIQRLIRILTLIKNLYRENFLRKICKTKNHFVTLHTRHNQKTGNLNLTFIVINN